jgi:hypothetical protein
MCVVRFNVFPWWKLKYLSHIVWLPFGYSKLINKCTRMRENQNKHENVIPIWDEQIKKPNFKVKLNEIGLYFILGINLTYV